MILLQNLLEELLRVVMNLFLSMAQYPLSLFVIEELLMK